MKRLQYLQNRLATAAEQARRNPRFGLPAWAAHASTADLRARPIICCGTGFWARDFLRNARDLDVISVVDDFHAGKVVLDRPCLDTAGLCDLAAKRPDAICINTGHSDAGYSHFERLGLERGFPMLNCLQAVRALGLQPDIRVGDWLAPITTHIEEFFTVASSLADPLSAETLYSVLLYHLETDREHLLAVHRPGEATYFRSGFFSLREREVYVDVGAFDGDSVQHFIRVAKGQFQRIHAFEPDPQNFPRLAAWHASQPQYAGRIVLHQQAVGSARGTVALTSTGDAGACVPLAEGHAGNCTVDLVTLDEEIAGSISLLKLDVEGHELEVLRGSLRHLQRDHPRLALCAYHLPTDLTELPRFLRQLDAGYRLGLRHHSATRYDTVLYAF